jgi:hypothetical protein
MAEPTVRAGWETARDVACIVCPACAFTFDADHEDWPEGGYSCPACAEMKLASQLEAVLPWLDRAYPNKNDLPLAIVDAHFNDDKGGGDG